MAGNQLMIVTDDGASSVEAIVRDETALLSPDALASATGWELKPQGLCHGDVCVPVRDRSRLVGEDDLIDLRELAAVLRRPLAFDADAAAAVLGEAASVRAQQRTGLTVEDFELHDVDGRAFRWSSLGAKKKLLFAWASW
jgi:hypothetical protein